VKEQAPKAGDIRFSAEGQVEYFDGEQWVPYDTIESVDHPPLLRDEIGDF